VLIKKFIAVSNAYEVLHDEETRKEYDNVLANPDALYAKYGAYVRFRYKQTNVWVVLGGLLVFASIFHYFYWWSRYLLVRRHVSQDPRVLARMKQRAQRELAIDEMSNSKKDKKLLKEELESKMKEQSLDEYVQVSGWQGRPPKFTDNLIFLLLWTPWTIWCHIYWFVRWQIKFKLLKHPYGPEEQIYATAAILGLTASMFVNQVPMERQEFFISKQLWVPENFAEFRREFRARRKQKY